MENKVLRNIESTKTNCPANGVHLGKKNDDEMYTPMNLIYSELIYWAEKGKFVGKKIICPCDWDIVENSDIYSITIDYLDGSVDVRGNAVPKITYDLWEDNGEIVKIDLKEDEIDNFLKEKLTCNFLRTLTQNARKWGISSISASGYNPQNGKGIRFQDVNYSKYDICITNPPFSLYRLFMKCIVDNIDFIVLAPAMNRVTPNVGLPLMLKKCYLGKNQGLNIQFIRPSQFAKDKNYDGLVSCDFITSFPEAQDERNEENAQSDFGVDYNLYKDEYITMPYMFMKDGTRPIRAGARSFPTNYSGWIFSNVGLLGKLDLRKYDWYLTGALAYFKDAGKNINPFDLEKIKESGHSMLNLNGKEVFGGMVFRLKPEYRIENN